MSRKPSPACGYYEVHGPHLFYTPPGSFAELSCPGWTAEDAAICILFDAVIAQIRQYLPGYPPAGLRLELHPAMRYVILRNPALADHFRADQPREDPLPFLFGTPVRVTTQDVPEYGWRLVIVTEQVLATGSIAVQ